MVDQCSGDGEALLLSARHVFVSGPRLVLQIHGAQQRHGVDLLIVEPGEQVDQLREFEAGIEPRGLQLHADDALDLLRLLVQVETADGDLPARFRAKRLDDLEGGGLAGSVGAQESEDLPLMDVETDPFHRLEIPIRLGQVADLDDLVPHVLRSFCRLG